MVVGSGAGPSVVRGRLSLGEDPEKWVPVRLCGVRQVGVAPCASFPCEGVYSNGHLAGLREHSQSVRAPGTR